MSTVPHLSRGYAITHRVTSARPRIIRLFKQTFQDGQTTAASLFVLVVLCGLLVPFLAWALVNADFAGSGPEDCRRIGACWIFVRSKFGQLMYGFYPEDARNQINLSLVLLLAGSFSSYLFAKRYHVVLAVITYLMSILLCFSLFSGSFPGMIPVPTEKWGGLSITLLLFVIGMGISFIVGGLLALGRRSQLTFVRSVCSVYVEFMRGVPLIAILFIAVVMFPLFLPGGVEANMFLRVLAGICLYTSSYMAEAIRAGLDAVPKAHYEAAFALGLSRWNRHKLVVFPQALTVAMPGLINTLVALIKDTSLVVIVGLHDFLGMTQLASSDVRWGMVLWEAYVFAGFVYFVVCYVTSYLGSKLERRGRRASGSRNFLPAGNA
jgi:general L-amino acid transport system permease protein